MPPARDMTKRVIQFLTAGLVLALSAGLYGCSDDATQIQVAKDGTPLPVSYEEIENGVYLCRSFDNENRSFYRLLDPAEGYSAREGGMSGDYIWYSGYDQAIPEFKKGDKLYLYSQSGVPESMTFWKLQDLGYTMGIRFNAETGAKSVTFKDADYCPYSIVQSVVDGRFSETGKEDIRITEINGQNFSPAKLLSAQGFVQKLTKDAMYKFGYYQGTVWNELMIKADTRVFVYESDLTSRAYVEEKDRLFEITLPDNMENGYWLLDGYGLFQYSAGESDLLTSEMPEADSEKTD